MHRGLGGMHCLQNSTKLSLSQFAITSLETLYNGKQNECSSSYVALRMRCIVRYSLRGYNLTLSVGMPRFSHQPLERPHEQIRLLQIDNCEGATDLRLSIAAYDLQTAPPYNALSYEWGDAEPTVEIFVNRRCLEIRHNLFLFLVELWLKQRTSQQPYIPLWADALCIHQDNVEERNAQVGMMGKIYRNAKAVTAWLGWPTDDTDPALTVDSIAHLCEVNAEILQELNSTTSPKSFSGSFHLELLESAEKMVKCSYWNRRWIIQELVLAKEPILLWGRAVLPFPQFEKCLSRLRPLGDRLDRTNPRFSEFLDGIPAQVAHLRHSNLGRMLLPGRCHILDLLNAFKRARCSVSLDKVYSLLELTGQTQISKHLVDYSIPLSQLVTEMLTVFGWENTEYLLDSLADTAISRKGRRRLYHWRTSTQVEHRGSGPRKDILSYIGRINNIKECLYPIRERLTTSFLVFTPRDLSTILQIYMDRLYPWKRREYADDNLRCGPKLFLSNQGLIGVSKPSVGVGDLLFFGQDMSPVGGFSEMLHVVAPDSAIPSEFVCGASITAEDESWLRSRLQEPGLSACNAMHPTGVEALTSDVLCPTARKLINIPPGYIPQLAEMQTAIRDLEARLQSEEAKDQTKVTESEQPQVTSP